MKNFKCINCDVEMESWDGDTKYQCPLCGEIETYDPADSFDPDLKYKQDHGE